MMQKTYILDTNVYGEILVEIHSSEIIRSIESDKSVYVYGLDIIEEELKRSPVEIKYKGRILKDAVVSIYKTLVDEKISLFPAAEFIASEYFKKFDELRKSGKYYGLIGTKIKKYSEDDLRVDFEIIAVASIKGIDIVVSADKRTILSKLAESTYIIVNKVNGFKTPNLVKYSDFKKRYSK